MEILTLDAPDAPWLADVRCPVHAVGPSRLGNYRYSPGLRRWLACNVARFDAVVVNGLWQHHGMAVWQVMRGSPIPYFVFTHGMLDPWFKERYPLKHLKKWLYWPWAEYRVLRDARSVLFTCEEEKLQARKSFGLYQVNEAVVNYGTPGPYGDRDAQREAFLEQFPKLRGKRTWLFLGRIHQKKGCDLLVNAFAAISAQDPDLQLVIAGPDPDGWQSRLVDGLPVAVRDSITWTGMLEGSAKWGAYHCAETFILPSHQENFGIAVAEALACGVPVLISDKVNIWREVAEDDAGFVASDTLAGTTRLLEGWLALSPAERDRMSQNATACFRKRFQINAAAASLVAVMLERIQSKAEQSAA